MSSIYRKGRDGYFYYQTYVINPKTGKKDKRIFHSLKTKDRNEAAGKQIELDKKYEKTINSQGSKTKDWIKTNSKVLIIILVTSIVTLYLDKILNSRISNNRNNSQKIKSAKIRNKTMLNDINSKKLTDEIFVNKKPEQDDTLFEKIDPIENPKETIRKPKIPSYKLERLERLSGNFEQIKIYLTVDKNTNSESLFMLCEKIIKDYSEYSNFVICLYSSDWAGIELAKGNVEAIGIEEQKRSWLALYTYNDVEGEYFDDNPSGYLGNN